MTRSPEQFRNAVERLIPGFAAGSGRLGLAISGGPDSLALLLLAHQAFPGRIAAATVDHGLRPEAADEARFVADICAERAIAHSILSPDTPIGGNIQSQARKIRYALLEGWRKREGLDWLATAHHADDQLETLLMRLLRGSGIDGLAGIRARRGNIVRPLLDFTKAELVAICREAGLSPVDDPSNSDDVFDRVRLRKALAGLDRLDPARANASAKALDDARDAIEWMVDQLWSECCGPHAGRWAMDPADLPDELLRRLLLRVLREVDPLADPRGGQLDALRASLAAGKTMTLGNILARVEGDYWFFAAAPPRKS